MRILIVHSTYSYKGGEDTVVEEEYKLLKSKGYEIEILLFDNSKNTLLNVLLYPFNFLSYFKTKKKLKQFRPDLVHVHNLHFAGSPSVIYAIKNMGIPCVLTLHNFRLLCPSAILFHNGKLFQNSLQSSFPWQAIGKKVYRNSVVLTFWISVVFKFHQRIGSWEKADSIIVLNDHMRETFINSNYKFSPEQITVKPNFTVLPENISVKKENYFLYVGRLSEEKGISTLLKAFEGKTDLKLKIVGDGPLKEEVKTFVSHNANVEYIGSQKKPYLFDLITSSQALIFPSICFEGMPLTIIEAYACGTPVIGSNLGAMKKMIRHGYNGLHFEAGDSIDLSEKLDTWSDFSSEEKCFYSANAVDTYRSRYTPLINFQRLDSIYQNTSGK